MVKNLNTIPHRMEVAKWVDFAWNEITKKCITNTWRRIGIHGVNQIEEGEENSEDDNDSVFLLIFMILISLIHPYLLEWMKKNPMLRKKILMRKKK